MEKRCTGPCKKTKPVEAFSKSSRAKDGLQAWCKECVKIRQQALYKPRDPRQQRKLTLKHLYGLTVEQWDQMLIDQSGLCALCDKAMTNPHTDHSHTTGEVRGLLCLKCNTALGTVEQVGLDRIDQYFLAKRISVIQALEPNYSAEAFYWRFLSSSYT